MCQYNLHPNSPDFCIRIPRAPPQTSANNEALGETMSSMEPSYPKGSSGRLSGGLLKTGSEDPPYIIASLIIINAPAGLQWKEQPKTVSQESGMIRRSCFAKI